MNKKHDKNLFNLKCMTKIHKTNSFEPQEQINCIQINTLQKISLRCS